MNDVYLVKSVLRPYNVRMWKNIQLVGLSFFAFFFLAFFFTTHNTVFAQETDDEKRIIVKGLKFPFFQCGNAANPQASRCCAIPTAKVNFVLDLKTRIGGDKWGFNVKIPGIEGVTSVLSDTINSFLWEEGKARKYLNIWNVPHKIKCMKGEPQGSDPYAPDGAPDACTCVMPTTLAWDSPEEVADRLCTLVGRNRGDKQAQGDAERQNCEICVSGLEKSGSKTRYGPGVWTAMGCIYSDFGAFIGENILKTGVSLAGFIALLCIIYSSIRIQISRGNPEAIQKARERMTSCIMGLLLIIFAILVLRVIGVDILQIPGFE